MADQALVRRDPDPCTLDLAAGGLAAELPHRLAHLGDGPGRDGFTEARQPPTRVDRDPATERGVAVAQQAFGLALLAQADVLVPVEFEGEGEVVDLGQTDVLGADVGPVELTVPPPDAPGSSPVTQHRVCPSALMAEDTACVVSLRI